MVHWTIVISVFCCIVKETGAEICRETYLRIYKCEGSHPNCCCSASKCCADRNYECLYTLSEDALARDGVGGLSELLAISKTITDSPGALVGIGVSVLVVIVICAIACCYHGKCYKRWLCCGKKTKIMDDRLTGNHEIVRKKKLQRF